jgi:hypothetical protein
MSAGPFARLIAERLRAEREAALRRALVAKRAVLRSPYRRRGRRF